MPSPSYFPMILALGLPILGYGAVFKNFWFVPLGAVVLLFGMYAWAIEPPTEPDAH
jgi:cytochrome c oxidase subunit 1